MRKINKLSLIIICSLVTLTSFGQVKNNLQKSENKDLRDECIRGQAEPIIIKSVFPNTQFYLNPDSLSGVETVDFENGDKLIINNWGCEYYTLTFRFETSRFQAEINDIPFWYKKSALLVSELLEGLDAPIDIKKGIDKLTNYIESDSKHNYVNLKLDEEIDFGIEVIRDFVILDEIEKLSNDKFAITISFSIGPL